MKILRFLAPAALLSGTAILVTPTTTQAWSLLGFQLGLNQRDFRVFNSFIDVAANDNTTIDDEFPGYDGAEVAIWKAGVEWGSTLHGDGSGDPSQPTTLGSGGANFDFSWQGNAVSAGSNTQNIVSATTANKPQQGVLAVTFSNGGQGWKILFFETWDWQDGPDIAWPAGGNRFDIQGIGCHELGHALGLGHSTVPGSTMFASVSSGGSKFIRSIEADDSAGTQANYGVAASFKPIITDVLFDGTNVFIAGTDFGATNNEVWFTQAGAGGTGTPVKALGVDSTGGGTSITVALPAGAGSGDVLVRKQGSAHTQLSNAFPFDENDTSGCAVAAPSNYCTAIPNSTGQVVDLNWGGSQSLSADDLVLFGSSMPANQFGIFITSLSQTTLPAGNGIVCVGSPFYRWGVLQADFLGLWSWDPPLNNPNDPAAAISAGDTWNFQLWYRDPNGLPSDFNFSDGLTVQFCD